MTGQRRESSWKPIVNAWPLTTITTATARQWTK